MPTTPRMRKANEKNAKVSLPIFDFLEKTWLKVPFTCVGLTNF